MFGCRLEARPGIEPGYKDLQSSAWPLRHRASGDRALLLAFALGRVKHFTAQ